MVAVNCFDNAPAYESHEVREALGIAKEIPALMCDVRRRDSSKQVLITLMKYLISLRMPATASAEAPSPIQ